MLDETIITETPPLYYSYGHIGQQAVSRSRAAMRNESSTARSTWAAAMSHY